MMFGLRDQFKYSECGECGCVQISEYPEDISAYYRDYYSLRLLDKASEHSGMLHVVKRRLKHALLKWSPAIRQRYLDLPETQHWLRAEDPLYLYVEKLEDPTARILDIGCGTGKNVRALYDAYYLNVLGIDPFISGDLRHRGRPLIRRASLYDITGRFDCISFHHVLEHMPDQALVLDAARRLLAPNGFMLIRIPIAGTHAWRTYQENWVQLDPPRHFYLHSRKSIEIICKSAGFCIESVSFDSMGFQIWGSELYRRNIPLTDPRSPWVPGESIFTSQELKSFEDHAAALNLAEDGDQVILVLRKEGRSH